MPREPRITCIGPGDLAPTVAMHRRCSSHTLWSRYHRAMADPETYLPALLARPGSVHLAARDTTGRIVAVGHLMPDHSAVEAALLVEDSWQGRGLGTRLLKDLGHHALGAGWATLYGLVLSGDERMDAILRHAPVPVHRREEGGTVTAWVETRDLTAVPPAASPKKSRCGT
ncbi:GNAT family N-acetyltransferase [Streptomyces sp. MC1]|uniref:GNAT family N-acetyltransferase n=1 Tax=Streptomyces sp. MC1 TaxID=295105 RepID=UPI0018CA4D65|nr:GNAT family N-acetyltransferase [Streptomyces sp. MC1]MBG7699201.1 GNAT family N-acetyltransferase [Streptomyces sp. MC1]